MSHDGLTIFWAHNEHVAVNSDFFGDPAAGYFLRQELGTAYQSVGMMIGNGVFRTRNLDVAGQPKPAMALPVGFPVASETDALFLGQAAGLYFAHDFPHAGLRQFLDGQYGVQEAQNKPAKFQMNRPNSDFDLIRWFPSTIAAKPLP